MRLFLAIELTDEVRQRLITIQDVMREIAAASWTRPENLHLTLKFLGETRDTAVAPLCAAMQEIRIDDAPTLTFDHAVFFPRGGDIGIIGAGASAPPAALGSLVEQIERACRRQGFPRESRRYVPHITIARARRPLRWGLCAVLAEATAPWWPCPPLPLRQFVLMESRLKGTGPEYSVLARFDLEKPEP